MLAEPRRRFAYQCLEDAKMFKYARKFDRNIPCSSRVMSVSITDQGRPAGCSAKTRGRGPVLHTSDQKMLKCISKQNLIKILYHVVHEL